MENLPEEPIPDHDPSPVPEDSSDKAWLGFIIIAAANLATFVFPIVTVFIGIAQLIWLVPLVIYFNRKGKKHMVHGMYLAAGISFLLNASCFGLLILDPHKF